MDNVGDPPNATVKVRFFNSSGSVLFPSQTVFQTPPGGKVPIVGYMHANGSSFFFLVNRAVPGVNAYDYDTYSGLDLNGSFKTLTP